MKAHITASITITATITRTTAEEWKPIPITITRIGTAKPRSCTITTANENTSQPGCEHPTRDAGDPARPRAHRRRRPDGPRHLRDPVPARARRRIRGPARDALRADPGERGPGEGVGRPGHPLRGQVRPG